MKKIADMLANVASNEIVQQNSACVDPAEKISHAFKSVRQLLIDLGETTYILVGQSFSILDMWYAESISRHFRLTSQRDGY